MALTVNHLRGTETPDAPSITLYAHLSDPRGTRSLLSYWWSIPTGGEGHSYEAPWPHANCMKCFLRSSLHIIPQLSTSLYPSGGHGQPSLALTGRKLIITVNYSHTPLKDSNISHTPQIHPRYTPDTPLLQNPAINYSHTPLKDTNISHTT